MALYSLRLLYNLKGNRKEHKGIAKKRKGKSIRF